MVRFFVRDDAQHTALMETFHSFLRECPLDEKMIEEEGEEAWKLRQHDHLWVEHFRTIFGIRPRPVFYELNSDQEETLKFFLKRYLDRNTMKKWYGTKYANAALVVEAVSGNFR